MKEIGITGTNGAGKETVVQYLVEKKGFAHFSVRKYLEQKLLEANRQINRNTLIDMGNQLRKIHGPAYLAIELYKQAEKLGKDNIIESLRNPYEVEALRNMGNFLFFAVDADIELRYERVVKRAGLTDKVSFVEFKKAEERESQQTDPYKQNLPACIQMADYIFDNNTSLEYLYAQVEAALSSRQK